MPEGPKSRPFTLDDFRKQMSQIGPLGPLQKVTATVPGVSDLLDKVGDVELDKDMKRLMGIVDSMTRAEKQNPMGSIDQGRCRRIAAGAGVEQHEINIFVKQFDAMTRMMMTNSRGSDSF
jgi:signal recognition particle subunit SRP54